MINRFYIIPRIGGVAYLNMAKAACSSINIALSQMRKEEGFYPPTRPLPDGSSPIHGFHPPYAHMELFFRRWPAHFPPLPASFVKFSFVRNPYDRIYSFYTSKIVNGQSPGMYYQKFGITKDSTFAECVDILTAIDPIELEPHAAPQSMILYDGEILLADFLGKVETFEKDWPVIQDLTGYELELEHANRTRNATKALFSEEIKQRIFDYYRDDFLLFDYEKDSVSIVPSPVMGRCKRPVFTAHCLSDKKIEELRTHLAQKNREIKRIAETFSQNPDKRRIHYLKQETLFHELILKNAFHLEAIFEKNHTKYRKEIDKNRTEINEKKAQLDRISQKQVSFKREMDNNKKSLSEIINALSRLEGTFEEKKDSIELALKGFETFRTNAMNTIEGHGKSLAESLSGIRQAKNDISKINKLFRRNILISYLFSRRSFWKRFWRLLHYRGRSEIKMLRKSSFVDSAYYFTIYPDTIKDGMSAATHYVRFGAQEGRNPSNSFDTVNYLIEHPEVVHHGLNPLVHYYLHK